MTSKVKFVVYFVHFVILQTFNPGSSWCKRFYWTVDSMPSPNGKVLRKMEAKVFQSQRMAILKDLKHKEWKGSKDQNSFADRKISDVVRKMLQFD